MSEQLPAEEQQPWSAPTGKGYAEPVKYYAESRDEARAEAVRLHELAYTDELTGLANKRKFDENLSKLINESNEEERKRIVVIAFDLDKFKEVNDTHGHPVGNETIKAEAVILEDKIPVRKEKGEVIARVGGDEYLAAIIEEPINTQDELEGGQRNLNDDEQKGVEGYINRIRTANEELAEILNIPQFGVSIGVARFQEPGFETETSEQFMQRVDENLYRDKAGKGASR